LASEQLLSGATIDIFSIVHTNASFVFYLGRRLTTTVA